MNYPKNLKYTEKDEWIQTDDNTGKIGISDFAQNALSDIVFLEFLISEGDEVSKGDILGTIESVKAASDIYFPISGKVVEINEDLLDTPEVVNSDPYGEAWMVKVELSKLEELDDLLDSDAYEVSTQDRE